MNEYNTTRKLKQGARKGLQRFLLTLLLGLLAIAGTATLILAAPPPDADFYGVITVSNNDTVATNVSVNCSLNTPAMVSSGYLNASANNCAVQNTGGTDVAFMPGVNATYPWCFWVPSIGADSYLSYLLYTGDVTGGLIRYFPGPAGMTADNFSIGDNFEVEQAGWCDTSIVSGLFNSAGYVRKIGALSVYNSAAEDITAAIGADCLDFERTNSDYVTISDQPEFTFATAGVDEPFSISAWVNFEDATSSMLVTKYVEAGNLREWRFATDANDKLYLQVIPADGTAYRGRTSAALTTYEGEWVHIAATYSGNEDCSGVNLYLNGVDCDTSDYTNGAYTGMTNTASALELGTHLAHTASFLDGKVAEVKLYDVELTPAQALEDYQTGYDSDLVGYWKLDDGAGNPQDSSGNAFHATANTADWLTATSVTASGVSSSNHTVTTSSNVTFLGLGIDIDDDTGYPTVTDNMVFNSPLWGNSQSGSPFYSEDAYGHTCTVTGATWTNQGYSFNPPTPDYITIPAASTELDFTSEAFTIAAWVNVDSLVANREIICRGLLNTDGYELFIASTGYVGLYTNQAAQTQLTATNGGRVTTDSWYHIVAVRDGANVDIYRNGDIEVESSSGTHINPLTSARNARIGIRDNTTSNPFSGLFGEIQIYNVALTSDEIEQNYNDAKWKYIGSHTDDNFEYVYSGVSVPDNPNDWEYVTGGAMPYMEYTKITVDGVLQQHIEWEYTEGDFTDLSLNGHDATPTFRTASSDADVSAELTMFLPVAEAQAPAWALDTTPGEMMPGTTTTTGNFSTTPTPTGAPFIAVIEAVSNATATPSQLPFTIIAGFIILAMSLGTSYLMRKNNTNSMLLKAIVIVALMGICIALDIFDFWMLVFFLIPAIAIIMLKSQGQEV